MNRTIELKSGVNRIGRNQTNDIVLPYSEVSSFHCEILVDKEFIFVRDMNSSNGTFVNGDAVNDTALYSGQVLQIADVRMELQAEEIRIALPDIPKPEVPPEMVVASTVLADGEPSCLSHSLRHAIWECPSCTRLYCDECIRKLRRVGGNELKLCPSCSNPCKLTSWANGMRNKRKGFFGSVIHKIADNFKRTANLKKMPPR